MTRTRLHDLRTDDTAEALGICQGDVDKFAELANTAQRRLLYAKEAGDEGWWGTWAEMVFEVQRDSPYLVLPREVARITAPSVRDSPITVENQWYEYLRFGNGRLPKTASSSGCSFSSLGMFARNNVPTQVEMTDPPNLIRMYPANSADDGKRVFLQGEDNNDVRVVTLDGVNRVQGIFATLASPFITSSIQFNKLTGIQKDETIGRVQFFQVNPTTGVETLILTMEPGEKTAWYRRYYVNDLPGNCCSGANANTVQLQAMVKLDLIPVKVDTDYLLIQNVEALKEEMQSVRYSRMDNPSAKGMAQEKHTQAIRLLNGELTHYNGMTDVAIGFSLFGHNGLRRLHLGQT